MDTGSILISLLVFLVFYQVIVRFSKKSPLAKVNSGEQMELLIEKFERLDRAFKYEINDMARSVAALQNLYAAPPQIPELLIRLERIESAIVSLEDALNRVSNQPSPETLTMPLMTPSMTPSITQDDSAQTKSL